MSSNSSTGHGPSAGPGDVVQHPEDPFDRTPMRPDEAMRQQMQTEIRVVRVERRIGEILDDRGDRDESHPAELVDAAAGA